ncbi:MAG: hypothetical protein IIA92_13825 [Chloroflexi bacterium]|nr:hypothetical protein [Chloroflexota bacterium]
MVAMINFLGLTLGYIDGPFTEKNFDFARDCSYFSVILFTVGMLAVGIIYADQWVSYFRTKPNWLDVDPE